MEEQMINEEKSIYSDFEKELTLLINKYNLDNYSNIPDYIIAKQLVNCFRNIDSLCNDRDRWFGVNLEPGNVYCIEESEEK